MSRLEANSDNIHRELSSIETYTILALPSFVDTVDQERKVKKTSVYIFGPQFYIVIVTGLQSLSRFRSYRALLDSLKVSPSAEVQLPCGHILALIEGFHCTEL